MTLDIMAIGMNIFDEMLPGIMKYGKMPISIITFVKMSFCVMTLFIMTLGIMTLSIMIFLTK
jgi:hypothetical protein